MDKGMTDLHPYFLPASGAVVVVICATENVLSRHPEAFERQVKFARGINQRIEKDPSMDIVLILLLVVCSASKSMTYEHAVRDFPALVTVDEYTPLALECAVRVLFG